MIVLCVVQLTSIVKLEVPVLEGLHFHMRVFHPFRPLKGFLLALQDLKPAQTHPAQPGQQQQQQQQLIPAEQLQAVGDRARKLIECSFYTDCCLLYTPSHIALSALIVAGEEKNLNVEE